MYTPRSLSFALTVDGARTNSFSSFEMVEGVEQNDVDAAREQNGGYYFVSHRVLLFIFLHLHEF